MTCRKCGKELPQDTRFCPYCGAEAEPEVSSLEEAAASPVPEDLDESSAAIPENPAAPEEPEEDKKDCVKCGEDIPDDSVLCSYCGAWQENETPESTEGLQKRTVDRRAFIAMAVVGVLLLVALILVSSILASLPKKAGTPEPRPEPEAEAAGDSIQPVASGRCFVEPDYEPMCPIEIQVNGERAYYIYLEYVWEPEDSYDSRLPIVSSPQEEDMAFYVESGSSAELYVPIGVYRVYYASGYSWQGPEELFGEDTEYNRDIYLLDFYTDEESAYGYTLELWDDTENNPDMEPIAPEDFPS